MDMKKPYRSIEVKAGRQKVSYVIVEIYKILTYNVINQHCTLLRVEVSCYEVPHNLKVDIFLAFSMIKVDNAIWYKAAVLGTSYSNYASYIASL